MCWRRRGRVPFSRWINAVPGGGVKKGTCEKESRRRLRAAAVPFGQVPGEWGRELFVLNHCRGFQFAAEAVYDGGFEGELCAPAFPDIIQRAFQILVQMYMVCRICGVHVQFEGRGGGLEAEKYLFIMGIRIRDGCEADAAGKGFPVQIGASAKAAGLVDPGGFQAVGKFLFPSFRFFFIHGGIAAV